MGTTGSGEPWGSAAILRGCPHAGCSGESLNSVHRVKSQGLWRRVDEKPGALVLNATR